MNKTPFIIFILSITLTTILWDKITLPYNYEKEIIGDSYHIFKHHTQNDTIRFLLYLGIPFISLITYYQFSNKKFLYNFKNLITTQQYLRDDNSKNLDKFFYILIFAIFFEFFLIDFKNQNYLLDLFHEGLWLSASQNLQETNQFWLSSYIARGFFGNFYPSFFWDFLGNQNIGITRLFNLLIVLINKILLIVIARQITLTTYFQKKYMVILFLSLAITFLYFTSYGSPLFFTRSFLLLLFITFLINFFLNKKNQKLHVLVLGTFSSISMFWYVDIGVYINFITLLFALLLLIRAQYKNFLCLILSITLGWLIIFYLFPKEEFFQFLNNTSLLFSTIEQVQGLIYPTPFLSMDTRSTKALLFFLITGFFILHLINQLDKKEKNFLLISSILFIIGIIYFKYGLSRSDSGHIRNALAFLYLSMTPIIITFILKFLINKKYLRNNNGNKIILSLTIILFLTIFLNKKYENKHVRNLFDVKYSIQTLINYGDEKYLTDDYKKFINYYKNLVKDDNCVMIFTNEVAISYLLRKKSCSKYYLMYSATSKEIQNSLARDINNEQPSFIVYKTDIDMYGDNITRLSLVNKFIKENYSFYEKFNFWEIYKKN